MKLKDIKDRIRDMNDGLNPYLYEQVVSRDLIEKKIFKRVTVAVGIIYNIWDSYASGVQRKYGFLMRGVL